jgi:hypothetical protein
VRARVIWFFVFAVLAVAAASPGVWLGDDDPPENAVPKARLFEEDVPQLVASGDFVRGAQLVLTISGLTRMADHEVDLTVTGAPGVSLGIGSATVDGKGVIRQEVVLPNALRNDGDQVPLEPSTEYGLRVTSRTDAAEPSYDLVFQVARAVRNTDYRVVAVDATACGGPPVAIAFDGRTWVPEDLSVFPPGVERYDGTIALKAVESAEFTSVGRTATLAPGGDYVC